MRNPRRPVAYVVKQHGLHTYAEMCETKKKAIECANDCLWWSSRVTITPLYAGKPIKWISKRMARKRGRTARG